MSTNIKNENGYYNIYSNFVPDEMKDDLLNLPKPNNIKPIQTKASELLSLQKLLRPKKDQKCKKLTGMQVMIPITNKAFFSGTLAPTLIPNHHSNSNNNDNNNNSNSNSNSNSNHETITPNNHTKQIIIRQNIPDEIIMMNLGQGYLAEMTIEQASNFIERRLESIYASSSNTNKFKNKSKTKDEQSNPKSIIKQNKNNYRYSSSKNDNLNKKISEKNDQDHSNIKNSNHASLPFIDIREEYDDFGNIIKSEAVNMADQLNHLKSQTERKTKHNKTNNIDDDDSDDIKDNDKESSLLTQMVQNISIDSEDFQTESVFNSKIEANKPFTSNNKLSEEKFQSMLSRLDELVQLEETTEQNRKVNLRSSKKLQSKGWAKGFLTNNHSGKKKIINKDKWKQNSKHVNEKNTCKEDKHVKKKTVVINEQNNQIRHIPKIANWPIDHSKNISNLSSSKVQSVPHHEDNHYINDDTNISKFKRNILSKKSKETKRNPISFEKTAFTGVIAEKDITPSISKSQMMPAPKKKLSRFVQQRQQGLR